MIVAFFWIKRRLSLTGENVNTLCFCLTNLRRKILGWSDNFVSVCSELDRTYNTNKHYVLFSDGDRHPDPKCGLTKNKRIEGGADATVSIIFKT